MSKRIDYGPPRWQTRTVAGIGLTHGLTSDGKSEWRGFVAGEPWVFFQKAYRLWQGYTQDHLTGMQSISLSRLVGMVVGAEGEWKAKLRVRRQAGTRMVDPVDKRLGGHARGGDGGRFPLGLAHRFGH